MSAYSPLSASPCGFCPARAISALYSSDMAYIKYIRDTYGIPIWFRWFSFEENKLYEGI